MPISAHTRLANDTSFRYSFRYSSDFDSIARDLQLFPSNSSHDTDTIRDAEHSDQDRSLHTDGVSGESDDMHYEDGDDLNDIYD